MKSAFIPFDERLALIEEVIKPGYELARSMATSTFGDAQQSRTVPSAGSAASRAMG